MHKLFVNIFFKVYNYFKPISDIVSYISLYTSIHTYIYMYTSFD